MHRCQTEETDLDSRGTNLRIVNDRSDCTHRILTRRQQIVQRKHHQEIPGNAFLVFERLLIRSEG